MKTLARVLLVISAFAMLALPLGAFAGERWVPLTKKLWPGTSVVQYGGQSITFITPVAIVVEFDSQSQTVFSMKVYEYASAAGGQGAPASATMYMVIRWDDMGEDIYSGSIPTGTAPFEGTFDTESGFTEKKS